MKLYRFSPILTYKDLIEVITYLDSAARELSKKVYNEQLPIAGNIGIFTHYQEEYDYLINLSEGLTYKDIHFNNKYFKLREPICIEGRMYEFLYIRKHDPYRAQVGDIDFVLYEPEFSKLKQKLKNSNNFQYIRSLGRSDVDMLEMHHPDSDVLAYIVPNTMSEELAK
jgi:hypothetical protein